MSPEPSDGAPRMDEVRRKARRRKRHDPAKAHAGGSGAVLGVRLLRYSGVQGMAQLASNLTHFVSLIAVASFLGPPELGRYSLLLFLANLITLVFHMAVKSGTIRRTFGGGDEDDDDDDDDEEKDETAADPKHTLGVGLVWAAILGLVAVALSVAFRTQIADLILGNAGDADLVLWAAMLGAVSILFKLGSMVLWLERRPTSYVVSETSRPLLNLIVIVALLAAGEGVAGAIEGAVIGTTVATVLTLFLLRGSYRLAFDLPEIWAIFRRGLRRIPIMSSFWVVSQADVFILSRFLDHADVGIYRLGSQLGIVVSFLPQGYRMALRPLRRSAMFEAVRNQYGVREARGQMLGYFVLLCITSVLLMVLGGELLVDLAPASYAKAAPLIPLSAAAMVMLPLIRTVNQNTNSPNRPSSWYRILVVLGTVLYVALAIVLVPKIGIYAPPVALLISFGLCSAYLFINCQRGPRPISFPYREVLTAFAVAAVIVGAFKLLPETSKFIELAIIAVLMVVYTFALFALRVIPESHWPAIANMAGSVVSGRTDRFRPRAALQALDPRDRADLRAAVVDHVAVEELDRMIPIEGLSRPDFVPQAKEGKERTVMRRGALLVRILRLAGTEGGVDIRRRSTHDWRISEFLFADEPTAVKLATMRRLLDEGANPGDLRTLEGLAEHLAKVPPDAWEGRPIGRRRRRAAAGRASRKMVSRAAGALGRRI